MIVLGLAEELRQYRIAANALWPKTTIATAVRKEPAWRRFPDAAKPSPGDRGGCGLLRPFKKTFVRDDRAIFLSMKTFLKSEGK